MKKIYIVPSQHFDIIWRKSSEYYKKVRAGVIKKSLELLKNYPEYRFYLDQAEVIREFINENPEYKEEIKGAIKSGRFEICGGGEVLTDTNMILGESIVRNILYGRIWLKKNVDTCIRGNSFIDTFGMCGQLPQIMENFKDKYFMAGRTPGGEGKYEYGDYGCFIWEGIDGSKAMSNLSAMGQMSIEGMSGFYGYGTLEGFDKEYKELGDNLENAMEKISAGLQELQQVKGNIINTEYTGEEHTPSEALPLLVREFNHREKGMYNYNIATPGEFFDDIDAQKLPVIKGEFNPIFTGCYTTRIELKKGIRACENALLCAERLNTMAKYAGVYLHEQCFADLWRSLNYVQFHDSICGCHIDESYEPLKQKIDNILKEAQAIRIETGKKLAAAIASKGSVVFFNTLDTEMCEVVEVPEAKAMNLMSADGVIVPSVENKTSNQFLIKVPAMGYAVYSIRAGEERKNMSRKIDAEKIMTKRYEVEIGQKRLYIKDNLLGVMLDTDNITLGEVTYSEDSGNMWVERLTEKQVNERSGGICPPEITENILYFEICYKGSITKDDLGNKAWDGAEYLRWSKSYRFYKDIDNIDLNVVLDWKGRNSTVIMKYPGEFLSYGAQAVYEVPFGSCKREAYKPSYKDNVGGTWPALNSAGLSDGEMGIAVANDGTPGYRIEDNIINVSMLRSGSDWQAPFFPFEPGVGSFDEGVHEFNISILPHKGTYFDAQAIRTGMKLNQRLFYSIVPEVEGHCLKTVFSEASFLSISMPNIILSALKESEDKKAYILRSYEIEGIKTTAMIGVGVSYSKALQTNMLEDEDGVCVDLSCLEFEPYEIKTIKLYL